MKDECMLLQVLLVVYAGLRLTIFDLVLAHFASD